MPPAQVYSYKDTGIEEGPTSARFIVVDYDPTTDQVEGAARWRPVVVKHGDVERELVLDFQAKAGTPQQAQINAWVTAVDTLDLFQQPFALGREIPWAFEGSRLRILPHAFCEANAFYSRQTRALHFGYFTGRDGGLVKTALSHDVIAHETAHAVLDGLRPYYLQASHPDAAAFHEFIGDLAAMLSLFRERESLKALVAVPRKVNAFRDLVGTLAPEVGKGLYGDADRYFLRSAANTLTYRDVRGDFECHRRSQVLSGFALDVLEAIYQIRVRDWRRRNRAAALHGNRVFAQLWATARAGVRLLLRPLDVLPPGGLRFDEYAATVLRLDQIAYPDDHFGYRRAVENVMQKRGIAPSAGERRSWDLDSRETTADGTIGKRVDNGKLIERDFAMIRSSRVGAYRFLNANRRAFGIPRDVDFRVVGVATNQREGDRGVRLPPETIIQYVWDVHVALDGAAKATGIDKVLVHPGGTLVIDEGVNVRLWSPQAMDASGEERIRRHVGALVREGEVETEAAPHVRTDRSVVAVRDKDGIRLEMNTAAMHRARTMGRT